MSHKITPELWPCIIKFACATPKIIFNILLVCKSFNASITAVEWFLCYKQISNCKDEKFQEKTFYPRMCQLYKLFADKTRIGKSVYITSTNPVSVSDQIFKSFFPDPKKIETKSYSNLPHVKTVWFGHPYGISRLYDFTVDGLVDEYDPGGEFHV